MLKRLIFGCWCALSALMVVAAPAQAQEIPAPAIGFLDVRLLLNESKAAKSIRPQMERLQKDLQREIRDREGALRKSEQELLNQRTILSPDAFAKRRRDFDKRTREEQLEVQARKRAIDRAFSVALNEIRISFLQIAKDVATEKKINIVMAKSAVLMSMNNLEITAETLKRLNQKLPKVTVKVEDVDKTKSKSKK
jgi:Skp family chaperone for outer membrane proteins